MQVSGRYIISGRREDLFELLKEPGLLRQCIPGCQELIQSSGSSYEARLKIGYGFLRGSLQGQVVMSEVDPPARCTMEFSSQGAIGSVKGTTRFILEPVEKINTEISYESEVQFEGFLSRLSKLVGTEDARRIFQDFFSSLQRAIDQKGK